MTIVFFCQSIDVLTGEFRWRTENWGSKFQPEKSQNSFTEPMFLNWITSKTKKKTILIPLTIYIFYRKRYLFGPFFMDVNWKVLPNESCLNLWYRDICVCCLCDAHTHTLSTQIKMVSIYFSNRTHKQINTPKYYTIILFKCKTNNTKNANWLKRKMPEKALIDFKLVDLLNTLHVHRYYKVN